MNILPIDNLLPGLLKMVGEAGSVVVQAPPGAGKTTRVPIALLALPFFKNKKIIMLEPRRLAAVNAARWMAASLGEEAGCTVGYTIRFDRKISAATRIEVVTEGILTRRLQNDPYLSGVGAVIFDEFHERSLNADLALALCLDARQGLREDLKVIVMSATLDQAPVAALLGNVPIVTTPGRSFPVETRYLSHESETDVVTAAVRAVRTAIKQTVGDILVFLPGGSEIRRCSRLLEMENSGDGPVIMPLYGDLPFADQERAIMPAERRKVVLATNIAETSLTIEGVKVVIDAGLTRQLKFDPATGLDRLVTVRVSAASAEQRAGRAGRLGPGICYRLWTEHTQRTLLPFSPPEIKTADLTGLALELASWGEKDAGALRWLDPPPLAAINEGRLLLQKLGAIDEAGCITRHGAAIAAIPIHPRLAHMILVGNERGQMLLACDIAALLSEKDIMRSGGGYGSAVTSDSDLFDRVETLNLWRSQLNSKLQSDGVDSFACRSVDRAARQLRSFARSSDERDPSAAAAACLLAQAYPDRIARRREPGSNRYLLANGRGGRLSPRSALRDREFIVAAVMEGGERGDGHIHMAAAVSLDQIREQCALSVVRQRMVAWDRGEERVIAREEERLGALVLASVPATPTEDEVRTALLSRIVESPALAALNWTPKVEQFLFRARFTGAQLPAAEWPDLSMPRLVSTLPEWLGPRLTKIRSLAGLSGVDLLSPLMCLFNREQLKKIEEGAPSQLMVPSGSMVNLRYAGVEPPFMEVKLQELFGLAETPKVAWGRVPVVLHLLSPAGRPVQVTRDLRGFWDGAYREVRKELKGRYPRHPWPEDPWSEVPTRHVKSRPKS